MIDLFIRLLQQLADATPRDWFEIIGRASGKFIAALLDDDDFKDAHPLIALLSILFKRIGNG